ncbi:hypothetical protein DFH08DRAFT_1012633 [Mycena albidolilacea]|uniref:Uncharacterized protein n=1 Tax=Mycena albidolilacea TaxID=1033008 RepID=A0AAD7EMM2_9AGAR|nr:hypothetical protein DFH08DRAFT_1012633 [Mycena albidolilacea]
MRHMVHVSKLFESKPHDSRSIRKRNIAYNKEARREQGGKREVVAGHAGRGNKSGGLERRGAHLESTPDSGMCSATLRSATQNCELVRADVRGIDTSEVGTRQGRDGWYERLGDQAKTANEEGRNRKKREVEEGRVVRLNLKPGAGVWLWQGQNQEPRAPPWFTIRTGSERAEIESGLGFEGVERAGRSRSNASRAVEQRIRSACGWVRAGVWGLDSGAVTSVPVAEENSTCDAPASLSVNPQGGVSMECVEQRSVGRRYARPASAKKQQDGNKHGAPASLGAASSKLCARQAVQEGINPGTRLDASAMCKVERAVVTEAGECTGDETGSAEVGRTRMGCERREGGRRSKQTRAATTHLRPLLTALSACGHARLRDDELIRPPHASQLPGSRCLLRSPEYAALRAALGGIGNGRVVREAGRDGRNAEKLTKAYHAQAYKYDGECDEEWASGAVNTMREHIMVKSRGSSKEHRRRCWNQESSVIALLVRFNWEGGTPLECLNEVHRLNCEETLAQRKGILMVPPSFRALSILRTWHVPARNLE